VQKAQQLPTPTQIHLLMVKAGRNMYCSDEVLKSLTFKILKLDVCCIKDGGEN
jgi:hypothetical protein